LRPRSRGKKDGVSVVKTIEAALKGKEGCLLYKYWQMADFTGCIGWPTPPLAFD
jgi:hypothetical protein